MWKCGNVRMSCEPSFRTESSEADEVRNLTEFPEANVIIENVEMWKCENELRAVISNGVSKRSGETK